MLLGHESMASPHRRESVADDESDYRADVQFSLYLRRSSPPKHASRQPDEARRLRTAFLKELGIPAPNGRSLAEHVQTLGNRTTKRPKTELQIFMTRALDAAEMMWLTLLLFAAYEVFLLVHTWHPIAALYPGWQQLTYILNASFLSLFLSLASLQAYAKGFDTLRTLDVHFTLFALVLLAVSYAISYIEDPLASILLVASELFGTVARIVRLVHMARNFYTSGHAPQDVGTALVQGRVPARFVAMCIAFIVVVFGMLLMCNGLLSAYELETTPFLRAVVPAEWAARATACGQATLFVSLCAWIAAYLSTCTHLGVRTRDDARMHGCCRHLGGGSPRLRQPAFLTLSPAPIVFSPCIPSDHPCGQRPLRRGSRCCAPRSASCWSTCLSCRAPCSHWTT